MKNSYKILIAIVIAALLGALFYMKVYVPKTTYKTITPTVGGLDVKVFGIGNLGAKEIYLVTAGVSATVESVDTDQGEWVKKGDLIARFDAVDLPLQLEESRIGVKKARSELVASQKELSSLRAQKNLALVTYKRYKKLKKQSYASQSEYDKAKADLEAIDAQIEATKAHIDSAKTEVERSKKSVEAMQAKLAKYKLYAPADGYVIERDAVVGQTLLPTQTVVKIVDPEDVWVKAYIDERISGDVKLGDSATIILRSHPDKHYRGVVKRVVAQSDPVTQEREVDVAFEKLPIPFYINEQAEVLIETARLQDVLKLPVQAVIHQDSKSGVWVSKEGKAHLEEVKVLAVSESEAAVDGISKDTRILIASAKNRPLKEGMKVH